MEALKLEQKLGKKWPKTFLITNLHKKMYKIFKYKIQASSQDKVINILIWSINL